MLVHLEGSLSSSPPPPPPPLHPLPDSPQPIPLKVVVACKVYLRDGSAETEFRAATRRQKTHIKLAVSPIHAMLMAGQPVP